MVGVPARRTPVETTLLDAVRYPNVWMIVSGLLYLTTEILVIFRSCRSAAFILQIPSWYTGLLGALFAYMSPFLNRNHWWYPGAVWVTVQDALTMFLGAMMLLAIAAASAALLTFPFVPRTVFHREWRTALALRAALSSIWTFVAVTSVLLIASDR